MKCLSFISNLQYQVCQLFQKKLPKFLHEITYPKFFGILSLEKILCQYYLSSSRVGGEQYPAIAPHFFEGGYAPIRSRA